MSTRDAILEAADQLFGEVGFEAASTRRIGELSGVNKALIHYHFKDKGELWSSVLARYYVRLAAALRPALTRDEGDARDARDAPDAPPVSLRDRMVALVGVYVDFLAANQTFVRMVQREVSGGRHVEHITAQMVPLFESGAAILHAAYPETREGSLSAAQLLVSFYGMAVSWVTYAPIVHGLIGEDPLSPRGLATRKAHLARMVDLVIDGLEAAPANPTTTTRDRERAGARGAAESAESGENARRKS
jgi:AcrR family transcriptional regulator